MDDVSTNYNAIGTEIMEMIYALDYLSLGGADATALLSRLGGIPKRSRILDVGSGLGGAAFYFAQHLDAQVCGIDLMSANVDAATQRARDLGLAEQVRFDCGDVPPLPYADESFDVVWGQDAWCHVGDKSRLIAEAVRILQPGGRMVFSDWLLGQADEARCEQAKRIAASPTMASFGSYQQWIADEALNLVECNDASTDFAARYEIAVERLKAQEQTLTGRYSQKVFDIVLSKHQFVLDAFRDGTLAFGSFVAIKPA